MPLPFDGEEFTFTNPDGTEFAVRGWGNQFAAVFETLDGYTVVKDPESGYYQYATVSEDGDLLPSGVSVGEVAEPAQLDIPQHLRPPAEAEKAQARAMQTEVGARPRWEVRRRERRQAASSNRSTSADSGDDPQPSSITTGNYVGLCLLIQFPDVSGTISRQEVTNYCNQVGYSGFGNTGSVRDYFHDVSDGRLTYTNIVTAYYTARNNRSHYTDPSVSFGTRARQLIVEALEDLKASGFNFSSLTADNSGYVRALNVFYAGPRVNNWSEGLWPHSWGLASPYVGSSSRKFSDYQITNMGASLSLRTFCHENGHMICDFPDLYDYGSQSHGVGNFCLMCYGGSNQNPVEPCAYLKRGAGWATTVRTAAAGMSYAIASTKNDFLLHAKNTTEYFIIENRQRSGRDAALPDEGLAVWHVDEHGSNNNEQMTASQHYECSLEQADGKFDLEKRANTGDSGDLFGAPDTTRFGSATTPNSRWWDSTESGLDIVSISAPGTSITAVTQSKWRTSQTVVRTHAKNGQGQAWAYLTGGPWLRVRPATADGAQNVFAILCEGLANHRKVDVLVDQGLITQATLR
jgi:M6 family metalloprotease-like protein